MTTTEFKINMKAALDKVDDGEKLFVTRGGKVYEVTRVNKWSAWRDIYLGIYFPVELNWAGDISNRRLPPTKFLINN